jgi:hypothetical protein
MLIMESMGKKKPRPRRSFTSDTEVTGTISPIDRRQVVLQARNSPSSPWYVVASQQSDGGNTFRFPFGTGGSRQ